MRKIIFCDKNKELVKQVKKVFAESTNHTHCELITSDKDDVFEYSVFGSPQQKIGKFTQARLGDFSNA